MRIAVLLLSLSALASAQTDWPTFGHDSGGNRYSPLKQITPQNVTKLTRAWTYHMNPAGVQAGHDGSNGRSFLETPL